MLIVVGAHLRAEVADRPLAYRLRERIHAWLEKFGTGMNVPIMPVVCTDIWYMNQEPLQNRPTISLGGPGVNALSAYYGQKLPQPSCKTTRSSFSSTRSSPTSAPVSGG